jgi:FlaA1/EpsC-like NDP-sugar epimerase
MTSRLRLASLSKRALTGDFSMRIFVTGATGHIGTLVVAELLTAGLDEGRYFEGKAS